MTMTTMTRTTVMGMSEKMTAKVNAMAVRTIMTQGRRLHNNLAKTTRMQGEMTVRLFCTNTNGLSFQMCTTICICKPEKNEVCINIPHLPLCRSAHLSRYRSTLDASKFQFSNGPLFPFKAFRETVTPLALL